MARGYRFESGGSKAARQVRRGRAGRPGPREGRGGGSRAARQVGGAGGYTAEVVFYYGKAFREEAVARLSRPEPLDHRLQVTAPREWMVLAGVGLSLLALLVWGVWGSVERSLAVEAVLVRPGERAAVTSPVSGDVVEILAEIGDTVDAGQAIARVRPAEARREARIARSIVDAAEEGLRRAGDAAALQEALLAAARDELAVIELRAGESIVAPRAGRLVAHRLVPGRPVRAGETVARVLGRSDDPWQALAFVSPADAGRLAGGMEAEVRVTLPARPPGPDALEARVLEVSARPAAAPAWLADLGLAAPPAPAHLLRLVLRDPPRLPLTDGAGARARIVLGRRSLAALLLAGGSV